MSTSDPLLTDQYTLVMAQSFWRHGSGGEPTVFDLFVRRLPEARQYLVAAGLADALDFLEKLAFSADDLAYLETLGVFDPEFLEYLGQLRFEGQVRAVPEGTVLPAGAPLLSVRAPRVHASIVEPALLAIINHQTMIASKAARIVTAAAGRGVWDFSLRRLHGPQAGRAVARAAWIAGVDGTATVAAGRDLGIPIGGTMAHHYVQSFGPEGEQAAFEQFLTDYPDSNTLLVDTWDTLGGVGNAIAASRAVDVPLHGIRLDSGDLFRLSVRSREILDREGFTDTDIFASGDLDEYRIRELVLAGAPIDSFGVGTMLGTSADHPYLGGVYKLVAQYLPPGDPRPQPVMKLSSNKQTDPGEHHLWRNGDDRYRLGLLDEETPAGCESLLETVMVDGSREQAPVQLPALDEIRERCRDELGRLPAAIREMNGGSELRLERSEALQELARTITAAAAGGEEAGQAEGAGSEPA